MRPKESYEVRQEMVKMHDRYLENLYEAIRNEEYVEAVWLCYAIIEQRVSRLIMKHIDMCPMKKREKDAPPVSISTRIHCIEKLIENKYGGYAQMDWTLFDDMKKWCDRRNTLVHGLVSLEHYKKYDEEFKMLAKDGVPIIKKLYEESNEYRKWYYASDKLDEFPRFKCKCTKQRCIYEK